MLSGVSDRRHHKPSFHGGTVGNLKNKELNTASSKEASSHARILKSSSIVGGSQAVGLVMGMVRTKLLAVILGASGPAAVGLLGVLTTLSQLLSTLVNLGVNSSGVREISVTDAKGDAAESSRVVTAMRRVLFVLGLAGSAIMFLAAPILGQWSFGNHDHTLEIRLLSVAILLSNIASGQTSILQGRRLLKDMALVGVWSALGGTLVSIPLYYLYGIKAVVPSMVAATLFSCFSGWYFSKSHRLAKVSQSWRETWMIARRMIGLGFAFLGAGFLAIGTTWLVQSMIARGYGQFALGNYTAAFRISGFLVSFILGAMTSDFFPRLAVVSDDHPRMSRLINEQIEIGILLCAPPLLGMLCFADWLIPMFYSSAFAGAVPMFRWLVLGCLGRVFAWPLGAVFMAKGASTAFLSSEIVFAAIHVGGAWLAMRLLGPVGAAIAFCILYIVYFITVYLLMRRWIAFRISQEVLKVLLLVLTGVVVSMLTSEFLPFLWRQVVGALVMLVVSVWALRTLGRIVDPKSQVASKISRIPGMHRMFGWNAPATH